MNEEKELNDNQKERLLRGENFATRRTLTFDEEQSEDSEGDFPVSFLVFFLVIFYSSCILCWGYILTAMFKAKITLIKIMILSTVCLYDELSIQVYDDTYCNTHADYF